MTEQESELKNGLPELGVRRPWLVLVMNLLIAICGIAALMAIEVRELPDVDRPVVSVNAFLPGASPETMDAEVTRLLEGAAARVAGVININSSSEENSSRTRIEFRPDIETDQYHIDILAARFVMTPERFDVVVGSNLFGDILSDLGPGVTGTIAVAPGGNINPERRFPSMFEPVHGSAPDIAGQDKANPLAMVLSAAMMLRIGLKQEAAAASLEKAVDTVLAQGLRTGDLMAEGCTAVGCQAMGEALLKALG